MFPVGFWLLSNGLLYIYEPWFLMVSITGRVGH